MPHEAQDIVLALIVIFIALVLVRET